MEKELIEGFAPLVNFQSERNLIHLEEGVSIRKMTKDERSSFESEFDEYIPFSIARSVLAKARHAISMKREVPFDNKEALAIRWRVRQILSSLRLYHLGNVAVPYIQFEQDLGLHQASDVRSSRVFRLDFPRFAALSYNRSFRIDDEEARQFSRFNEHFATFLSEKFLSARPEINLACGRFEMTNLRSEVSDEIIDTVVGLEALFVPEIDELPYRLANRVSIILGGTDSERDEVSALMKAAYKARSKIVHGANVPETARINDTDVSLHDLSVRIQKALAQGIKTSMTLSGRYTRLQLIELADRSLTSLGSRGELQRAIRSNRKFINTDPAWRKEPQ